MHVLLGSWQRESVSCYVFNQGTLYQHVVYSSSLTCITQHNWSWCHCTYTWLTRILKDVVTPHTHISEASRYILYTIILTIDGICTLSWSWVKMWSLNDMARFSTAQRKTARSEMTQYRDVLAGSRGKSRRSRRRFLFKQTQSQLSLGSQSDE